MDIFWKAFTQDVPEIASRETIEWNCADCCSQGVFPIVAGFDWTPCKNYAVLLLTQEQFAKLFPVVIIEDGSIVVDNDIELSDAVFSMAPRMWMLSHCTDLVVYNRVSNTCVRYGITL